MKRWWVTIAIAVTTVTAARADDVAPGATPATPSDPPTRRAPTGTFEIGASINTDDGFGAAAAVTQSDLFGTGTLLSLDASANAREQRFGARYLDPALLGSNFQLEATLVADYKHLADFSREGLGPNLTLSHATAPHSKLYLTYRFEHVRDVLDHGAGDERYDVSALRAGSEYNTLSEPFMAQHGSRAGAYIEVASRALGSGVDELRAKSYVETHHALGGGLILHLGGSMESVAGNDGLPSGERLYFDESSQVRGYAPNALGPRLGGNFAVFGRAELEMPITHGLSTAAFVDGGGLMDVRGGFSSVHSPSASTGELAGSTGFGLVWRSPIGPIGGYLAWTGDGGPRFVFGVGQAF